MISNVLFKNYSDEFRRLTPADSGDYAPTEALTFMCWFKGKNDHIYRHISGHKNLGFSFGLTPISKNSHLTVNFGLLKLICDKPIENNEWCHLAMTWDGSRLKFYINSVLNKEIEVSKIIYGDRHDRQIWVYKNFTGSSSFQMTVSDIGLWHRVISPSEINSILMCDNVDLHEADFYDRVDGTHVFGHNAPQTISQIIRQMKDDAPCPMQIMQSSDSSNSSDSSVSSNSSNSSNSSGSSESSSLSSISRSYSSTSQTPNEELSINGPLTDYPFIVPDDVYDLYLYVEASRGGVGYPSAQGGPGAKVIGRMPVIPGETVLITIGNVGSNSGRPGNGGRDPGSGGGGGGGSKVIIGVKKVIAGGGGGGGGKGGDTSTGGTGGTGTPSPEGGTGGTGGHGGQRTGQTGNSGTGSFTAEFDNTNTASGILNYPYETFVNPNPGHGLVKIRWNVTPESNNSISSKSSGSISSQSSESPISNPADSTGSSNSNSDSSLSS